MGQRGGHGRVCTGGEGALVCVSLSFYSIIDLYIYVYIVQLNCRTSCIMPRLARHRRARANNMCPNQASFGYRFDLHTTAPFVECLEIVSDFCSELGSDL